MNALLTSTCAALWAVSAAAWAGDVPSISLSDDHVVRGEVLVDSSTAAVLKVLDDPVLVARIEGGTADIEVVAQQRCKTLQTRIHHPVASVRYTAETCPTGQGWKTRLVSSDDLEEFHRVAGRRGEGQTRILYFVRRSPARDPSSSSTARPGLVTAPHPPDPPRGPAQGRAAPAPPDLEVEHRREDQRQRGEAPYGPYPGAGPTGGSADAAAGLHPRGTTHRRGRPARPEGDPPTRGPASSSAAPSPARRDRSDGWQAQARATTPRGAPAGRAAAPPARPP